MLFKFHLNLQLFIQLNTFCILLLSEEKSHKETRQLSPIALARKMVIQVMFLILQSLCWARARAISVALIPYQMCVHMPVRRTFTCGSLYWGFAQHRTNGVDADEFNLHVDSLPNYIILYLRFREWRPPQLHPFKSDGFFNWRRRGNFEELTKLSAPASVYAAYSGNCDFESIETLRWNSCN